MFFVFPGWCIIFAPAPRRRPTALLLPLPIGGAGANKTKKTWVVCFFALAPPTGLGAQRGATTKKNFARPGTTAKKSLETSDTGHEQKGATK